MEHFEGRVAVVSGASSGIGAEIARQLVRAGVVVVGVARRPQLLREMAAELSSEKGKFHPYMADISRGEEVRRVFQWIDDHLGGVSILVNNAAMLVSQPIQDAAAVSIQQIVNTNLTAVMLSCREAINSMKKHDIKDGHIININSVLGHRFNHHPQTSTSAYSVTKFGITALCQGLRYDTHRIEGFKTRVTSISPGVVATEMVPDAYLQRMKEPDDVLQVHDVGNAVMYALSSPAGVEISEISLNAATERNI